MFIKEQGDINRYLNDIQIDVESIGKEELSVSSSEELEAWKNIASLPATERRRMEREEAKRQRKLWLKEQWDKGKRKRPGARRGKRHWKRKQMVRNRRRDKMWATSPFDFILNQDKRKCKRMDRAIWNEWAQPLWEMYEPKDLYVKWPRSSGSKANPYSMLNIRIYHKEKGLILDGNAIELYILSGTNL